VNRAFIICGVTVLLGLISFGLTHGPSQSPEASSSSSPRNKNLNPEPIAATHSITETETVYVFDHSPLGNGDLVSKNSSVKENQRAGASSGNALWFQDQKGHDRFIAENVVTAKFSPDGSKIAYVSNGELFIETFDGERLAQIPRAFDPVWRADGSGINFSATASAEYPELLQAAVYDLKSGAVILQSNEN
jgi:hypothetical protein